MIVGPNLIKLSARQAPFSSQRNCHVPCLSCARNNVIVYTAARFALNVLASVEADRLIRKFLRLLSFAITFHDLFGAACRAFDVHVAALVANIDMAYVEAGGSVRFSLFFNALAVHRNPVNCLDFFS